MKTQILLRSNDEEDSEGTVYYTEGGSGESLLVIEGFWKRLPDTHKLASNTASFSFLTPLEGVVQDVTEMETTPATYAALSAVLGAGHEDTMSQDSECIPDDPQAVARWASEAQRPLGQPTRGAQLSSGMARSRRG